MVEIYVSIRRTLYGIFLRSPGVRGKVQSQVAEAIAKLEGKLVPKGPGTSRYLTLPKEAWTEEQVRAELEKLGDMEHTRWEDGLVSGAVYHGGDKLIKLQADAFQKFSVANPIHPDVFPGVRKMEAEVVAMVLAMFNAPAGGAGVTTSGGTESILMACLSARQKGRVERGVTEPEMCVQVTADVYHSLTHPGSCPKLLMQHFGKQEITSVSRYTLSLVQHLAMPYTYPACPASSTAILSSLWAPRPISLMA